MVEYCLSNIKTHSHCKSFLGIATQTVVERQLQRDENKTRHDLGRDKFVEQVWKWRDTYGGKINNQIRRLGASVDWEREAFTMNPVRFCSRKAVMKLISVILLFFRRVFILVVRLCLYDGVPFWVVVCCSQILKTLHTKLGGVIFFISMPSSVL